MKIEGKVAIVAGAGLGIGEGIVYCLAKEGADVAVVDINRGAATNVADKVKASGRKALVVEANLLDSKDVKRIVQETLDALGKIDILVNVIGGHSRSMRARMEMGFVNEQDVEWDENYELNLKSQIMMCRAVAPHFIEQKSGKIINIASQAGKRIGMRVGSYGTMKAALIHFTKSLAMELAEHNINVNAICPGELFTPLRDGLSAKFAQLHPEAEKMTEREFFEKFALPRMPLGREQTPEDIGLSVVFLASEDGRNITGQALNVDGGETPYN